MHGVREQMTPNPQINRNSEAALRPGLRGHLRNAAEKLHLLNTYRRIRSIKKEREFNKAFNELYDRIGSLDGKKREHLIVVTGILRTPKKPTLFPLFDQVREELKDTEFFFLDEHTEETERNIPGRLLAFPNSLSTGKYYSAWMRISDWEKEYIKRFPMIDTLVDTLLMRQKDQQRSSMIRIVCAYARTYESLMKKLQPDAVIIWCEFTKMHPLCAEIAKGLGIPVLYMEFGSVPGTFALESQGQMGESKVATEWRRFLELPVTQEEVDRAGVILEHLKASGANRNVQTQEDQLDGILAQMDPDRPLVVFAGQNDYDSGIIPWNDFAKQHHMPIYRDSEAAARGIWAICRENGWNFLYKPHPFMRLKKCFDVPNVTVCNFNHLLDTADVVVTGVSSTNYSALIRGTACVGVGFNQMRGKGCHLEVTKESEIADAIRKAITDGFTKEQRENFRIHTAQLLKYALFDDLKERELRYGRPVSEMADLLRKTMISGQ